MSPLTDQTPLTAALEAELRKQRALPYLMRSSGYESGIEFALRAALAHPSDAGGEGTHAQSCVECQRADYLNERAARASRETALDVEPIVRAMRYHPTLQGKDDQYVEGWDAATRTLLDVLAEKRDEA